LSSEKELIRYHLYDLGRKVCFIIKELTSEEKQISNKLYNFIVIELLESKTDSSKTFHFSTNQELIKLVIEHEYLVRGNQVTTEDIANAVKNFEGVLCNTGDGIKHQYMRVSDNEPILLQDLAVLHQLNFIPSRKDEKEAAINDLRLKFAQKKIIINKRCTNLIYQLKTTTWNKLNNLFSFVNH
jgi:DNA replication initiation complex subunit (GINS family)